MLNRFLLGAAALAFLIGLAHSVIGEWRIFRHLRRGALVPTQGAPLLREFQVRILWGSWHMLTVLGWALAALLLWLAQPAAQLVSGGLVERVIAIAMAASGAIVLVSNRGRHPAWIALWAVALLVELGR